MSAARPFLAVALLMACSTSSCDDDEEAPAPGGLEAMTESPAGAPAPECLAFCAKANECARAEGRRVPPEAADCDRSCRGGGVHRMAPESLWACRDRACGDDLRRCTLEIMMTHMRGQDVAAFPPVCEGLCNKTAWCRQQRGEPLGEGEDDCAAACGPGGAYAEVPDRELLCTRETFPCGPLFDTCRRRHGPSEPPRSP